MALILLLETATAVCSAGLALDGEMLSLRETDQGLVHGEKLAPFIEEILIEAGKRPSDLSAVAVSMGPGSYTGLRVGLSTAKGMALGLGIPLIGLSTLEVLASAARAVWPGRWIMPAIDARRQEVYAALYDPQGLQIRPPGPLILDQTEGTEWLNTAESPVLCVGDGALKVPLLWGHMVAEDSGIRCSAAHMAHLAEASRAIGSFADLTRSEPVYLKPAHVTTPVKGLLGR